jgi:alcohol dehydrogenase class IV
VVCGTLVAAAPRVNIEAMQAREPENPALDKYARLAGLLCDTGFSDTHKAHEALIKLLDDWVRQLNIPRLGRFGVKANDFTRLVANSRGSSMKTNPVVLTDGEIAAILQQRL